MTGPATVFLNFHGIGDPPPDVPDAERRYWCPQADWPRLADALAEVHEEGRVRLAITFDDGNRSDVDDALPALVERGLTAVFFPCAGRLGRRDYVGAEDIRGLRAAGMGIGSHGWDHVDLRRVDDVTLELECRGSKERLEEVSGGPIEEFAVPFGSYDRRVLRALRGYSRVLTSDGGPACHDWLTPRTSYVRGWGPGDVLGVVTRHVTRAEQLQRRAKVLLKSLR